MFKFPKVVYSLKSGELFANAGEAKLAASKEFPDAKFKDVVRKYVIAASDAPKAKPAKKSAKPSKKSSTKKAAAAPVKRGRGRPRKEK